MSSIDTTMINSQ